MCALRVYILHNQLPSRRLCAINYVHMYVPQFLRIKTQKYNLRAEGQKKSDLQLLSYINKGVQHHANKFFKSNLKHRSNRIFI